MKQNNEQGEIIVHYNEPSTDILPTLLPRKKEIGLRGLTRKAKSK